MTEMRIQTKDLTDSGFNQPTWLIDSSTHNMLNLCDPSQSSLCELRPDRQGRDFGIHLFPGMSLRSMPGYDLSSPSVFALKAMP